MHARVAAVGGNWKMNLDLAACRTLAGSIASAARAETFGCEITLFPPYPYLPAVESQLRGTSVRLGAQDLCERPNGAMTGEVSAAMLVDVGVTTVIVGHSERRHIRGEHDALVAAKLDAALSAGLQAVLCVGERLEDREAGRTLDVVLAQIDAATASITAGRFSGITLAYEPVWAIGTGLTASPADAQPVHAALRAWTRDRFGALAAEALRIEYGGSVKASLSADLIAQPDIDGFLVGGASLSADEFLRIVRSVEQSSLSTAP